MCLQSDIPMSSPRLHNLHPWYWNSLLDSLLSSGENSAFAHFAAAIENHYNLAFSFHQVPGYCWVDRGLPNTSTHGWSKTRAPVTHPSTNRARHCLTSVTWCVNLLPLGHVPHPEEGFQMVVMSCLGGGLQSLSAFLVLTVISIERLTANME